MIDPSNAEGTRSYLQVPGTLSANLSWCVGTLVGQFRRDQHGISCSNESDYTCTLRYEMLWNAVQYSPVL